MILLLDANALLPTVLTPGLLSPETLALPTDTENELLVSHATLWEMLAKVHRGQVRVRGQAVAVSLEAIRSLGAEFVPITEEDVLAAVTLPDIHRDPFDRMLVAQAFRVGASILSSDRKLQMYGVPVIAL